MEKSQIQDPASSVNYYLTELDRNINNDDEIIVFKFFQAAVAKYNTGHLLYVLDKNDLLSKVFYTAVKNNKIC